MPAHKKRVPTAADKYLYKEYPSHDKKGQQRIRTQGLVKRWQEDTVAFVKEAIGVGAAKDGNIIDPKQEEIMREFDKLISAKQKQARGDRMTLEEKEYALKLGLSIRSGKGAGKTSCLAWMSSKFLSMFKGSKLLATAPKQDLLRDNLWGEIAKWKRYSTKTHGENSYLFKTMVVQADKVYMKSDPKEWFMVARTCSRNASEADQKATLQGYHADYQLIVVDEAWGVPDAVFEPLITTLTRAVNIVIMIGNPTKNYGYAHDTWEKPNLSKYFVQIQINCEESTLVTPEHIQRQREIYADDPNGYRVNVLGLPPEDGDDALIPYSALTEARYREFPRSLWVDEPVITTADIGAGGDITGICHTQGPKTHKLKGFSSHKADEVAREIAGECMLMDSAKCGFDGIGVGWGIEPLLRAEGIDSVPIDVRNRAFDHQRFFNLRSELYWTLREDFIRGNISIDPADEELINELATIKLDKPEDATKIKVMSKAQMRKEGALKKSPNKADSLMLSRYFTRRMVQAIKSQGRYSVDHRYGEGPSSDRGSYMSL